MADRRTAAKKTAAPPPEPAADPLADLREPDAPVLPGGSPVPGNDPEPAPPEEVTEEAVELIPMVTAETQEEMVSQAVAAWHQDPTAQGFLHGGGSMCGCRYIARVAIQAAVPVMTEEDLEEKELEPHE